MYRCAMVHVPVVTSKLRFSSLIPFLTPLFPRDYLFASSCHRIVHRPGSSTGIYLRSSTCHLTHTNNKNNEDGKGGGSSKRGFAEGMASPSVSTYY
mmetsp:Transcript_25536/g.51988  ORF Transcript_25536/g.51988 Transcript_25536/m.51988 type:complete len:96 (+) Transcript_25536:2127-2414(+)